LILRKIIKIIATRCHILQLKCTIFSAPQIPKLDLRSLLLGDGKGEDGREGKGTGEEEGRGGAGGQGHTPQCEILATPMDCAEQYYYFQSMFKCPSLL